ncbi:MAG TPA: hypothetical protein VE326_05870 [Candidatus Binatia bacterium]|nr:hypothetical protein [Candidatus Binatia bacterium]
MKSIVLTVSLLAAVLAIAAPAVGKESPPATPSPAPALFLSRVDQVMISTEEFSDWMAHHKTRMELRDTNKAIEQMCDRLQDAERRMSAIASDSEIKPGDAQGKEIQQFGNEIGTVARELTTLHASLRRIAEATPAVADSVASTERQRIEGRQSELIAALDLADKHARETHAWMIEKPAPRGLDEMCRDMDLSRDELRGVVTSLGRLAADPVLTSDRVRDLVQIQDCSRALLAALGQAQDRIEALARTP